MADERTDVATIEEMSAVFCRWEEDGVPEEHFLEVVHWCRDRVALVECLREKQLQVTYRHSSRIIAMGFDGISTFSGKKAGVQTMIKKMHHTLYLCTVIVTCYS